MHSRFFEAVGVAAEFPGSQSRHFKHEVWLADDWSVPSPQSEQVLSVVRVDALAMNRPAVHTVTAGQACWPFWPCHVPATQLRHCVSAVGVWAAVCRVLAAQMLGSLHPGDRCFSMSMNCAVGQVPH